MRHRAVLNVIAAVALCAVTVAAAGSPFPEGRSERTLVAGGETLTVYAYKPPGYRGGPILLSLHGLGTNAAGYREYAEPIANAHGMLVVAPLFDRKRFPTWRYQAGGLVRNPSAPGTLQPEPEAQWTGQLFIEIIAAVRSAEAAPTLPYYAIGHSAGGQSLSRFAAFVPNDARRIVIANPSTYIWPTRDERFPYGFGGLPERWADDAAIRRYLAQPVTLLLGTADVNRDADLNVRDGAERQGANRYERGNNAFRAAQTLAESRGWTFNWKLVDVPGAGHSARRMFGSPEAVATLDTAAK